MDLINKHFKENSSLINRNNCKLSYSCISNIKMLIQGHNKTTLRNIEKFETKTQKQINNSAIAETKTYALSKTMPHQERNL